MLTNKKHLMSEGCILNSNLGTDRIIKQSQLAHAALRMIGYHAIFKKRLLQMEQSILLETKEGNFTIQTSIDEQRR